MACLQNQLVSIELLIAKGADINSLDVVSELNSAALSLSFF